MNSFELRSRYVDILNGQIFPAVVSIQDGKISAVNPLGNDATVEGYLLPGFIDSHVHIESSMLIPAEFARLAVTHGTIGTVSDPHEIANVCGMGGVEFMIDNGRKVPFYFNFGAPSCVPATVFETAGAELNSSDVQALLSRPEIRYLSEMMNFPGVLSKDREVMKKIAAAQGVGKPVDGHAPGLRGEQAANYIAAGISTDHECFTREEAEEKLQLGMKILIREGSAARNFDALIGLLDQYPDAMMFCSDDKHPDNLEAGHINQLCARAVSKGVNIFNILKAACVNPVMHYQLESGLLKIGDNADMILVNDLQDFKVIRTWIKGGLVAENGQSLIDRPQQYSSYPNQFDCDEITANAIRIRGKEQNVPVIEALDGQLITNRLAVTLQQGVNGIEPDPGNDVLKIVVVNRYFNAPPAVAFIRNIGLKEGAIASSVAHDSHNIVATGVDDESIVRAVNAIIRCKGGVSCVDAVQEYVLPLPVAGLMSAEDGYKVAAQYTAMDKQAKQQGSTLQAPYMTLSFMALLVIPHLKLSDKGLFDGDQFRFLSF